MWADRCCSRARGRPLLFTGVLQGGPCRQHRRHPSPPPGEHRYNGTLRSSHAGAPSIAASPPTSLHCSGTLRKWQALAPWSIPGGHLTACCCYHPSFFPSDMITQHACSAHLKIPEFSVAPVHCARLAAASSQRMQRGGNSLPRITTTQPLSH